MASARGQRVAILSTALSELSGFCLVVDCLTLGCGGERTFAMSGLAGFYGSGRAVGDVLRRMRCSGGRDGRVAGDGACVEYPRQAAAGAVVRPRGSGVTDPPGADRPFCALALTFEGEAGGRLIRTAIVSEAVRSQIRAMPYHRFKLGQTVVAPFGGQDALIPSGPYVIVRLLPLVGREPHYRVKSTVDGHERALLEAQLRLIVQKPAKKEPAPAKALSRRR